VRLCRNHVTYVVICVMSVVSNRQAGSQMHEIGKICSTNIVDVWGPKEEGLDRCSSTLWFPG
jgi:hypothetical protein